MSRFKVGDRVRVVGCRGATLRDFTGHTGTITEWWGRDQYIVNLASADVRTAFFHGVELMAASAAAGISAHLVLSTARHMPVWVSP
jgi:hypothetical protein